MLVNLENLFIILLSLNVVKLERQETDLSIEFDSSDDLGYFTQQLGGGGWGNSEKQIYTDSNAIVLYSNLYIYTERTRDGSYYSSRLVRKKSFRYGTF